MGRSTARLKTGTRLLFVWAVVLSTNCLPHFEPDRVVNVAEVERSAAADQPTTLEENELPGSTAWQIPEPDGCADKLGIEACQGARASTRKSDRRQIEGYASAVSVAPGESFTLYVSVSRAASVYLQVFRLGWYGGLGGRLMSVGPDLRTIGPLRATRQPDPKVGPPPDRIVEADWQPTVTLRAPPWWTTGYYVVKLVREDGYESNIPLVVRDDSRSAEFVVQASVATWQAYNTWGGRSLYGTYEWNPSSSSFRSRIDTRSGGVVSFDRPYADLDGSGEMLLWELNMVRWLERERRDLRYVTDLDLDRGDALRNRPKALLLVGHNEYWSERMRAAIEAWRDSGGSIGFFGANIGYWRIHIRSSANGDGRRIVCYKNASIDPSTVLFRDMGWPENSLIGVMHAGIRTADFVISDATSWVYEGLGVMAGERIANLVGNEYDRRWQNGAEPAGLHVFAHSRVSANDYSEATYYRASSGALVVAVGTVQWAWALDGWRHEDRRIRTDVRVSPLVQNITRNLLRALSNPSLVKQP